MSKKQQKDIGITTSKEKDFSEWYQQIILKAELADYTKVSGCMVFRPKGFAIWENIQTAFNKKIKKDGVKNVYFPIFIPESLLTKEADHVEGFTPEVAWVTHGGNSPLNERLAIRPTSETVMYDSYKKWIRSYNDLPLRLNQWCNAVRWEFKHPVPFIRGREFLWQEGHTVFADKKDAEAEVFKILDFYEYIYNEILAIPVLKGVKTEREKFAGADFTTSVEAYVPNGKMIQGATSHHLGNNFAKAFDITFTDEEGKEKFGWQNSWGMSTRTIGTMVMVHSDDKGLVLPPKVADVEAVIIPIYKEKTKEKVIKKAKEIKKALHHHRIILDERNNYSPGWKFHDWELKGIPIRIEIGPKDIEKKQITVVRRDSGKKEHLKWEEAAEKVTAILHDIQKSLFKTAKKQLKDAITTPKDMKGLIQAIDRKSIAYIPFCDTEECEANIKDKTGGAKSLVKPLEQPKEIKEKCINCTNDATCMIYFGKSY